MDSGVGNVTEGPPRALEPKGCLMRIILRAIENLDPIEDAAPIALDFIPLIEVSCDHLTAPSIRVITCYHNVPSEEKDFTAHVDPAIVRPSGVCLAEVLIN
jgi:hypothetical protein